MAFPRLHERNPPGEIAGDFLRRPYAPFLLRRRGALFWERVM
ncbi:hypothetical protein HMPREF1153_1617 [Selenomonas sp. CM52]|nr:hypothetical protein HMPREF1153_1617 [Selenomonas sp. CM52]